MPTTTALETWGKPSPWTSHGREIQAIDRNTAVQAKRDLARAEIAEFDAALRKRFVENRLCDANDVMNLALQLAHGDPLIQEGLMEIVGNYLITEARIFRNTFN